jgi:tRNA-intron endonuclease
MRRMRRGGRAESIWTGGSRARRKSEEGRPFEDLGSVRCAALDVVTAEVIEDKRLVVWSPEEGSGLYSSGFYGKPLGISKPRESDFDVPLILDLIEGVYLLEKGRIRVVSGPGGRRVSLRRLRGLAERVHDRFGIKYRVYWDLRERGYVVTPGIKYGCDFAVYERGPGIDHAPFIVQVKMPGEELSAFEVVRAGRLATTVRKTFIVAVAEDDAVTYLGFEWWKP